MGIVNILVLKTETLNDNPSCFQQILHGLKSKNPNLVPFAKSYLDILTDSDLGEQLACTRYTVSV